MVFFNPNLHELIDCIKEMMEDECMDFPSGFYWKNGGLNWYKVCDEANLIANDLLKDVDSFNHDYLIETIAKVIIADLKRYKGEIRSYSVNNKTWEIIEYPNK